VKNQFSVAARRSVSTRATAPFLKSISASQPDFAMIFARNSVMLGLCPTTMIASCFEYFSNMRRKSANEASGFIAGSNCNFAS